MHNAYKCAMYVHVYTCCFWDCLEFEMQGTSNIENAITYYVLHVNQYNKYSLRCANIVT
jgi:hypothetical protein